MARKASIQRFLEKRKDRWVFFFFLEPKFKISSNFLHGNESNLLCFQQADCQSAVPERPGAEQDRRRRREFVAGFGCATATLVVGFLILY